MLRHRTSAYQGPCSQPHGQPSQLIHQEAEEIRREHDQQPQPRMLGWTLAYIGSQLEKMNCSQQAAAMSWPACLVKCSSVPKQLTEQVDLAPNHESP